MALWTAGVRDGNSAGLLSSVLQGGKAIVDRRTDVGTIQIVNAENTTFLPHFISSDIKVHLILVHWSFLSAFAFYHSLVIYKS